MIHQYRLMHSMNKLNFKLIKDCFQKKTQNPQSCGKILYSNANSKNNIMFGKDENGNKFQLSSREVIQKFREFIKN
jgi:hypothetical protein